MCHLTDNPAEILLNIRLKEKVLTDKQQIVAALLTGQDRNSDEMEKYSHS